MLGGSPAPDIARRKQRGHEHPRIVKNVLALKRVQGNGDIGALLHTAKPALLGPACEHLCGGGCILIQNPRSILHTDNIAGLPNQGSQAAAAFGQRSITIFQMQIFSLLANYNIYSIAELTMSLVY